MNYNKIQMIEIVFKYERVINEITALKSYLACFEREWGIPLDGYKAACEYDIANIANSKKSFETFIQSIADEPAERG